MSRAIVAAVLALICSGCAPPMRYAWDNEAGRDCYYQCKRATYQCNAGCFKDAWCEVDCLSDQVSCLNTCPHVRKVPR